MMLRYVEKEKEPALLQHSMNILTDSKPITNIDLIELLRSSPKFREIEIVNEEKSIEGLSSLHAETLDYTCSFGKNKRRAFNCDLTIEIRGKQTPKKVTVVEYSSLPTTSSSYGLEKVVKQINEIEIMMTLTGASFAPEFLGYIVKRRPVEYPNENAYVYYIDGFVIECIGTYDFTLHQVIRRTDIHTLGPMSFFLRQLLGLMVSAANNNIVLRNIGPRSIIIYRSPDKSMLVKYLDYSDAGYTGERDDRHGNNESRYDPSTLKKDYRLSPSEDIYCLGRLLMKTIFLALKAVHGIFLVRDGYGNPIHPDDYDDLDFSHLREQLAEVPCRSDSGIISICINSLSVNPWKRISAMAALRTVNPLIPTTFTNMGSLSHRISELPYAEEFDWDKKPDDKNIPNGLAIILKEAAEKIREMERERGEIRSVDTTAFNPAPVVPRISDEMVIQNQNRNRQIMLEIQARNRRDADQESTQPPVNSFEISTMTIEQIGETQRGIYGRVAALTRQAMVEERWGGNIRDFQGPPEFRAQKAIFVEQIRQLQEREDFLLRARNSGGTEQPPLNPPPSTMIGTPSPHPQGPDVGVD